MAEFRVRVEIDVDVESGSPIDAAKEAWRLLRSPDCEPWFCEVFPGQDTDREPIQVDLDIELDPNRKDLEAN